MAALGAALLVWGVAPASAELRWSDPVPITEQGPMGHRSVMDARGNVLAVWQHRYGDGTPTWQGNRMASSYRWYQPGRGWGPAHDLPRSAGWIADIAITPRGEAHALVVGTGAEVIGVGLWTAAPGKQLAEVGAVTDAAFAGATPALGVDDVGNAIVAWSAPPQRDQPFYVSMRAPGGSFGEPQKIGEQSGGNIDVAMNPAGAAAVKWVEGDGRPRVAYRPAGGQFGGEEVPGLGPTGLTHIGIDLQGRVIAAGRQDDGVAWTPGSGPQHVAVVVRSPLGGWSEQQIVQEHAYAGSMVVAPHGVATLFTSSNSETTIVTRHPDGRLERESLGPDTAGTQLAAVDHRGDVLAAFAEWNDAPQRNVFARARPVAAAGFAPPTVVGPGNGGPVSGVSLNDLGQAVVVWTELARNGERYEHRRTFAAVRDDPALHEVPAPPDVTIYKDPLAALDGDGDLRAQVRCDQRCKVSSAGIVFPGGSDDAVPGRGKSVRLKARRRSRVKIDFGEKGAEAVRDAIAAGRRPWVSVTVSGRGKSPRPLVVTRRLKLRR